MIQIRGLSKTFGNTQALSAFDLEIEAGEIHAICGENGAGKSTLNKILAGLCEPDCGEVLIDGIVLPFGSVHRSEVAGVSLVPQETSVFPDLSAIENHEIMREPTLLGGLWLDRNLMAAHTHSSLQGLGEPMPLQIPLGELGIAYRQMASIARALSHQCKLLILDEPTASLSHRETQALLDAIRKLREQGVAILFVTHRLGEVFEVADRVTVLRDGSKVATRPVSETSREELIRLMVGRDVGAILRRDAEVGETVLKVKGLHRKGWFHDISFELKKGEIVGLSGLFGAGRSEIATGIVGIEPLDSGEVLGTKQIALVPEDRQGQGLHLAMTIRENIAMPKRGPALLNRKGEEIEAGNWVERLSIKASSGEAIVGSLSGGNQQKVLLAKWLQSHPEVLILDEPTRGVDIGAKEQIHQTIRDLADSGQAILLISSDLTEILELSNRILVLRQGEISGQLEATTATQDEILALSLPTETPNDSELNQPIRREKNATSRGNNWHKYLTLESGVIAFCAVLLGVVGFVNPAYLTSQNLLDLLVKAAPSLIVGTAMTFVILSREVDISVGSLCGLCAAILGVACSPQRLGLPIPLGLLMCLGAGVLVGAVNGVLVSRLKIPSIIVTLGMMTILRGVTEYLLAGKWIEHMPDSLRLFGTGNSAGIPNSALAALFVVCCGLVVLKFTPLGLRLRALGSDPHVAEIRGLPVGFLRISVFVLTGLACGISALFGATQLQVIESGYGSGFELTVIAAVVIGGTSILGGKGTVIGTAFGAFALATLSSLLIFLKLGVSAVYWERAIQGALILAAVLFSALLRRKGARQA